MDSILKDGAASLLFAIALCASAEEPAKRDYAPLDRALLREYLKGPTLSEMVHAMSGDERTARAGCPPIYLPALPLRVGGSDVWKNLSGTEELEPFRLEDGRAFLIPANRDDPPCMPVVSREDWTVSKGGRRFALYEVDPIGSATPSGIPTEDGESLWIGLVGKDARIERKILLARDVKDVSGIRIDGKGGAFVAAKTVGGTGTNVALRFPEPWPALRPTGDPWRDYEARRERRAERFWEDYPDIGSGYAAEHVSVGLEEALLAECSNAVARLKELTPSDSGKEAVDVALGQAVDWAGKSGCGAIRNPYSTHWNNVLDFEARAFVLEACLRTWLEATEDVDGWKAVRSATGTMHGKAFAATGGVAVVALPARWIRNRLDQTGDPWEDEPAELPVLIRLSPKGAVRENGILSVRYEMFGPFASRENPGVVETGAVGIEEIGNGG